MAMVTASFRGIPFGDLVCKQRLGLLPFSDS